ncbi:hypothetical protein [Thalassovita taeanensis]|uniref:Uncharacterized protein n=1 Tax=Thalassovita taeanensis TaxID=657014 RepID=A0A1H8YSL7_9RHOB|nr:hypothetical protein [Thalassovita taeanensis]SEP55127.1 hypothetical protein SAMN04488092_10157 [Thalassovita taeanensis]
MKGTPMDPKGLIADSFQIDGISEAECRSIFLDWALSLPDGQDSGAAIEALSEKYQQVAPDHPMMQVLVHGRPRITAPRRRGGWRSRERN